MVTVITENEIVLAYKTRDDAGIHRKTGGQAERFFLAYEGSQFLFELDMDIKRSVQEPRSCASGTIFLHRFDAGLDDTVVSGQSGIGVGSEHQDRVSTHLDFSSLLADDFPEVRINAFFLHLLRQVILGESFVQKIHFVRF